MRFNCVVYARNKHVMTGSNTQTFQTTITNCTWYVNQNAFNGVMMPASHFNHSKE